MVIAGATPEGRLTFNLPGLPPPRVRVVREEQPDAWIDLNLDTVIVDTDVMRLSLLWRGNLVLKREPLEVRAIQVEPGASEPSSKASPSGRRPR